MLNIKHDEVKSIYLNTDKLLFERISDKLIELSKKNSTEYNNIVIFINLLTYIIFKKDDGEIDNKIFINNLAYLVNTDMSVIVNIHIDTIYTSDDIKAILDKLLNNLKIPDILNNKFDLIKINTVFEKGKSKIDILSNNYKNKLYDIKYIDILNENKEIEIERKDISLNKDDIIQLSNNYIYEKDFFNQYYKYNILKLNYEYLSRKKEDLNIEQIPDIRYFFNNTETNNIDMNKPYIKLLKYYFFGNESIEEKYTNATLDLQKTNNDYIEKYKKEGIDIEYLVGI